ncbi:hypothetical protein FNF31_01875 [Cafeteria roenbergensis]|uniref:HECT domain-containing protein n=1 Tax=Cafeteria roenbergensis TaxID=33653 RepID=A0A5A8DNQ5_CAFRO|nr:hypothetical protein FNF31_01875 [Cafeteria roenbergensis]
MAAASARGADLAWPDGPPEAALVARVLLANGVALAAREGVMGLLDLGLPTARGIRHALAPIGAAAWGSSDGGVGAALQAERHLLAVEAGGPAAFRGALASTASRGGREVGGVVPDVITVVGREDGIDGDGAIVRIDINRWRMRREAAKLRKAAGAASRAAGVAAVAGASGPTDASPAGRASHGSDEWANALHNALRDASGVTTLGLFREAVLRRTLAATLEAVGILLGIAVRASHPVPCPLAPLAWELLAGRTPASTPTAEALGLSEAALRAGLSSADADAGGPASCLLGTADTPLARHLRSVFSAAIQEEVASEAHTGGSWEPTGAFARLCASLTFAIPSADGEAMLDLLPGGSMLPVPPSPAGARLYVRLAVLGRMAEVSAGLAPLAAGLSSLVPLPMARVMTPRSLRTLVCGTSKMDVGMLRRHTRLAGFDKDAPQVGWLFSVLDSLPAARQATILRFIWARDRLPSTDAGFAMPFTLARLGRSNPDGTLPQAHTCSFQLDLPPYSSEEVLRERLCLAAAACAGYDLDGGARGDEGESSGGEDGEDGGGGGSGAWDGAAAGESLAGSGDAESIYDEGSTGASSSDHAAELQSSDSSSNSDASDTMGTSDSGGSFTHLFSDRRQRARERHRRRRPGAGRDGLASELGSASGRSASLHRDATDAGEVLEQLVREARQVVEPRFESDQALSEPVSSIFGSWGVDADRYSVHALQDDTSGVTALLRTWALAHGLQVSAAGAGGDSESASRSHLAAVEELLGHAAMLPVANILRMQRSSDGAFRTAAGSATP